MSDFVQLKRTFYELSKYARQDDTVDVSHAFHVGLRLSWDDLINEYRLIILSEAGSGKTAEISNAARNLRANGKAAFFIRLEHVATNFDISFEVGTHREFMKWLSGNEEGWILLDSIDEARLRSPRDFELAISKLGSIVGAVKDRTHIIITGRITAWRPKTDLSYCLTHLPYVAPVSTHETNSPVAQLNDEDDDGGDDEDTVHTKASTKNSDGSDFKIVTLRDLDPQQVALFIKARGIVDTRAFLDAVERADATSFTTRPQDLEDLTTFWLKNGQIGSRLDIMRNSIDRRLSERDQSRAEARPLAADRVREGVTLIAATTTLSKDPTIRVPDGADNTKGIPITSILPHWDEVHQTTLLARPIFDEAIYGTVRFHHRSVREYLTAE